MHSMETGPWLEEERPPEILTERELSILTWRLRYFSTNFWGSRQWDIYVNTVKYLVIHQTFDSFQAFQ